MIASVRRGANSTLRAAWWLAGPLFVVASVVVLIDWLPIAAAGVSVSSLLKGAIALPVGLAFAFGASRRRFLALLLVGVMGALLVAFSLAGYPQTDPAVDTAVLSIVALSGWLLLPYLVPRALRRPHAPDIADVLRAPGGAWAILRRCVVALRSWVRPVRWSLRALAVAIVIATLGVGVVVAWALAARVDLAASAGLALVVADGAAGSLATWFLSRRLMGQRAAAAASVLWACCSVRLEVSGAAGGSFLPTCLLPAAVLLLVRGCDAGMLRGAWFALALTVLVLGLASLWPLLALTVALATILVVWGAGYARDARWGTAALAAWLLFACTAIPNQTVARLFVASSLRDPAHVAAACASGCDGGLPWEFLYPSALGSMYSGVLIGLLRATVHWGNYRQYAISPGWGQLALAAAGGAILWRRGRRSLLFIWLAGIALGILLALPSHYLGLGLPSLARLVSSVAPGFTSGAQASLLSALFVVFLGGFAVSALAFTPTRVRLLPLLAVVGLVAADVVAVPVFGHPGFALAKLSASIARASGPPRVAFYPFLTPDYGAEFDDLARVARRNGLELINRSGDEAALGDISDPNVQAALRARGVRFVAVSLSDYVRRREILDEAHILLPVDQEGTAAAWLAPEAADLVRMHVLRADADGSLLLAP